MLQWFDDNPARYWWLVCLVISVALFALVRPLLRTDWRDARRADWRWAPVIVLLLLAGRWPTWWVTRQLDPDENQFIAGALTLRHDPVFWRSVDGMTSGPLDYYALLPVGWLRGIDDYFTARLTAFLLLGTALVFAHQACALLWGVLVARVAGFATVCFESLALRGDFLHYSSELVPLGLLALGLWLLVRRSAGGGWRDSLAGGLVLGAVPLSKLQAVPLAVALALVWIVLEYRRRKGPGETGRPLRALLAGLMVPLLVCAALLTLFGLWPDMMISYLLSNVGYVGSITLPPGQVLGMIWRTATAPDALLPYWLLGGGLWLLLALSFLWSSRSKPSAPMMLAAGFCVVSLVCILVPQRPFLHYWQLLVIPGTLLLAGGLEAAIRWFEATAPAVSRGVLLSALLLSAGPLLFARAGQALPYVGRLTLYQAHPRGAAARALREYAQAGEPLGVWGWMASFYAEADLRQATREAFSHMQILHNPYSDYYRRRYLSDLERSAPPVFVDAIGPVSFGVAPDRLHPDVIFPALAAYLCSRYTQVADLNGVLILVRNDRLTRRRPQASPALK